jgi:Ca2+-binding RTX toxin-like protein
MPGLRSDGLISGGASNDHLAGFGGADAFVFKSGNGHDAIADFQATGKHHDTAALLFDGIDSFAHLKDHMSQHGHDVVLAFDNGDSLTLHHVDMHELRAGDFSFS